MSAAHPTPAVFTLDGFLDAAACAMCRAAMDEGGEEAAEVLADGIERQDQVRRTASVEVAADVLRLVEERLDGARQALAAHFGLPLAEREGPGFLRYRAGGFYRAHRDRGEIPAWPGAARRCVSVVLFLNDARELGPGGEFSGGALRLLPDDATVPAVEIHPRAGTLVAFPSTRLHEVAVVVGGTRDAVVDWFYEPG